MDDHDELSEASAAVDQVQDTVAAKMPEAADRRMQRLQDLYADALEEPKPLRANLRAATADFWKSATVWAPH